MLDRIPKLIKSRKISASQFADEIGVQRSSVSHVLSGRNKPSLDFITKIIVTYPEVNPKWLLTGHGSMYSEDLNDDTPSRLVNQQTSLEVTEKDSDVADHIQAFPGPNNKAGSSKTTTGSDAIDRIVIFFRNGTYEEFTP